jgi:hypothetical protein
MIIAYGETMPPYEGYGPDDAVLEVLVNVGVTVDPGAWWVHPSQDPIVRLLRGHSHDGSPTCSEPRAARAGVRL